MYKFIIVPVLFFLSLTLSYAQLKYNDHLLGPTLGFSTKSSTVIFGANYEYVLPQAGPGCFAVGGLIRYWLYSEYYENNYIDVTTLALGGQCNYDFNTIGSGKFVPFAGLFLGYQNVSSKYTASDNNTIVAIEQRYKSNFQAWGQAGMRYFFTPKIAGVFRLGLGNLDFSTIEIGADIKL